MGRRSFEGARLKRLRKKSSWTQKANLGVKARTDSNDLAARLKSGPSSPFFSTQKKIMTYVPRCI